MKSKNISKVLLAAACLMVPASVFGSDWRGDTYGDPAKKTAYEHGTSRDRGSDRSSMNRDRGRYEDRGSMYRGRNRDYYAPSYQSYGSRGYYNPGYDSDYDSDYDYNEDSNYFYNW